MTLILLSLISFLICNTDKNNIIYVRKDAEVSLFSRYLTKKVVEDSVSIASLSLCHQSNEVCACARAQQAKNLVSLHRTEMKNERAKKYLSREVGLMQEYMIANHYVIFRVLWFRI